MSKPGPKRCSACKSSKALTEFSRNRSMRDGRRYECRECDRKAKNIAKRQQRLREIKNLDFLLCPFITTKSQRIAAEHRYSWFIKHARHDRDFDYPIEGESLTEARRRWLVQRTKEQSL